MYTITNDTQKHIFICQTVDSSTAPKLDSLKFYTKRLYEKASLTPQFAATNYQ